MELVSVYVPTHNRSQMLVRALKSILAQTYSNIEIIVVDDGSTDNTQQVLSDYRANPAITVLRNPNPKGACHARNRAIFQAKGVFITGVDDDDEIAPDHIRTLMQNYEDRYSFVASSVMEDTGQKLINRRIGAGVISLESLLHHNKIGNQILTRTERFREVGGFDESLPAFQDYDMWVRLAARYGSALRLSSPTYILHTGHEKQRISHGSEKRIEALGIFVEKHSQLMSDAHRDSMEILRRRISGDDFVLKDFIRLANRGNIVAGVALYLNRNLTFIKRGIDAMRHRG